MSKALHLLIFLSSLLGCFGQGQVVFANKVGTTLDAPVFLYPLISARGPGPDYSAQLLLVNDNQSLMPLLPISTFRPVGIGIASIADHFWVSELVDVPAMQPGASAKFLVRAWLTTAGSYESAVEHNFAGQSAPFTINVGGGTLPPTNLTTLTSFVVLPEPSTVTLGVLGSVEMALCSRRSGDANLRRLG